MADWILIENDIVVNAIVADEDFIASHPDLSGYERIDVSSYGIAPSINWRREDGKWKAPDTVVPKNLQHRTAPETYEIEVIS
jgi:hypothetical protein